MDSKAMKKVGITMSTFMGIAMSFFLSLTGTITSGHFTVPSWLISFVISGLISMVIGIVIPMKKVNDKLVGAFKLPPFSFAGRCLESFVSDLIYTPLMTFCMVFFAYKSAIAHGAPAESLSLGGMFLSSFFICFVVGFVLIIILMPIFLKISMKMHGLDPSKKPM